jgi:hypothetical protein
MACDLPQQHGDIVRQGIATPGDMLIWTHQQEIPFINVFQPLFP